MYCLWNVLDVNKYTSSISHKANESIVAIVTKQKDRYRSAVAKRRKTVSSVSREKPEATVGHLLLN
jgi:hypothetical protein